VLVRLISNQVIRISSVILGKEILGVMVPFST